MMKHEMPMKGTKEFIDMWAYIKQGGRVAETLLNHNIVNQERVQDGQ